MLRALVSLCAAKAPTPQHATRIASQCAETLLGSSYELLEAYSFPEEGSEAPLQAHVERAIHLVRAIITHPFTNLNATLP